MVLPIDLRARAGANLERRCADCDDLKDRSLERLGQWRELEEEESESSCTGDPNGENGAFTYSHGKKVKGKMVT